MPSSSPLRNSSRLAAETAAILGAYGTRSTWPQGFPVYQKGFAADGFSVVLRGHVLLRSKVRAGRGFVPAIATPGETFGVEGVIPGGVYVTDAIAAEETETFFVSGVRFRAFVRENPAAALDVIGCLMSERVLLLEKLHAMASQNVEQRLMSALLRLAGDRSFLASDGSVRLEVKHHRLLCEMVGATRESIALGLNKLVEAGQATRCDTAIVIARSTLTDHITAEEDVCSTVASARETAAI